MSESICRLFEVECEGYVVSKVMSRLERGEKSMKGNWSIVRNDRNVDSRSMPIFNTHHEASISYTKKEGEWVIEVTHVSKLQWVARQSILLS